MTERDCSTEDVWALLAFAGVGMTLACLAVIFVVILGT